MYQRWRDLLFLHWEYPAAAIQETLPDGLFVDTFGGKAYLGIVPFFMENIRPRRSPAVPPPRRQEVCESFHPINRWLSEGEIGVVIVTLLF